MSATAQTVLGSSLFGAGLIVVVWLASYWVSLSILERRWRK